MNVYGNKIIACQFNMHRMIHVNDGTYKLDNFRSRNNEDSVLIKSQLQIHVVVGGWWEYDESTLKNKVGDWYNKG